MREKRDKSNKKFMLLSAIGIFMVVDSHTFTAIDVLGNFVPYNSFFMPMFVFISGYFNKVNESTNLWTYFTKKVKTLLVPYAGLSLTAFAVQQIINVIKLGNERVPLPGGYLSFVLRRIVTEGTFGGIVTPMWFVITLFSALVTYAVIRKLLGKIWNSYAAFVLFCALHFFAVYYSKTAVLEDMDWRLVPLKCLFFYPFIELGVLYRDHLEKRHSAMQVGTKIAILFGLLVINAIRTTYLPNAHDVAFDSLDDLTGFMSPYFITPMVSSLIGILFWLTAVELIGKQVYESKFVNYVSCNTFWIMGLHVLFFNVLNCVFMGISRGIVTLPYFDVETFQGTEWYFWEISNNIKILYVLVGVLGPLGLKLLYDKMTAVVNRKIESIGAGSEQKTKTVKVLSQLSFAMIFIMAVGVVVVLTKPKPTDGGQPFEEQAEQWGEPGADGEGEQEGLGPDADDPAEEQIIQAYAYLDLIYEYNGAGAEYLAEPCYIYDNGTYTVTIRRGDDKETAHAMDGLGYMGIRFLQGETADADVSRATITEIRVKRDGTELGVNESGTIPYENGAMSVFFDCYDGEKYGSEEDISEAPAFDFKGTEEMEVTFTISGIEGK